MQSEWEFQDMCSECLIKLEEYKLKTNLIGCNMKKEQLNYYYNFYRKKTHIRLQNIIKKMEELKNILIKNFKYCQASELRVMNNCIRNYRKRMGELLTYQPTPYSYSKFEKQQQLLLKYIVLNDKKYYESVAEIAVLVQSYDNQANKALNEGPQPFNPNLTDPYTKILNIIDETQIQAFKYYDNFERSMYNMINEAHAHLDKFNNYLNAWENISSTKAYQTKTKRELQIEAIIAEKNNLIEKEDTLQDLYQRLARCPPYSPYREEIIRRVEQLKSLDEEVQRRQNRACNMSNKRRNKRGILKFQPRYVMIADWYKNFQKQKVPLPPADKKQIDAINRKYTENDKKTKETKTDILAKYVPPNIKNTCWYDTSLVLIPLYSGGSFNVPLPSSVNTFELIDFPLTIVQKRIEFQNERQIQLQQQEERRRKDAIDQQKQLQRQEQRRNHYSLNVGYKFLSEREQLDHLIAYEFSDIFLPKSNTMILTQNIQKKLEEDLSWIQRKQQTKVQPIQVDHIQQLFQPTSNNSIIKQVIDTYFEEVTNRQKRKSTNPQVRIIKYLYLDHQNQIGKDLMNFYSEYNTLVMVLCSAIIVVNKHATLKNNGKIYCQLIMLQQIQNIEDIKNKVKHAFSNNIIKFKTKAIKCSKEDMDAVMVGILQNISRNIETEEGLEKSGKQILKDVKEYFNREQY